MCIAFILCNSLIAIVSSLYKPMNTLCGGLVSGGRCVVDDV